MTNDNYIENNNTENLEDSHGVETLITYKADPLDILRQIVNILGYLGVLAILSYPIIHIINKFCNINKFVASLPLGYTSGDETMVVFGILCLFFGLKMCLCLMKSHSITARIVCIIAGIAFMVFMCSKEANDILLNGVELIVIIAIAVFIGIPMLALCLKFTPFGMIVPPNFIPNYYRALMKIFPKN